MHIRDYIHLWFSDTYELVVRFGVSCRVTTPSLGGYINMYFVDSECLYIYPVHELDAWLGRDNQTYSPRINGWMDG